MHLPGVGSWRQRRDDTEVVTAEGDARSSIVLNVEDVKELGTELEVELISKMHPFHQGEIRIVVWESGDGSSAGISVFVDGMSKG